MPTMTAFFTRFCKKINTRLRATRPVLHGAPMTSLAAFMRPCLLLLSLFLLLPGFVSVVLAGSIEAQRASIASGEESYTLTAEFNIDLGRRLDDVVTHGIPLYFDFEAVLERPRKYWSNEHIATRNLTYRLSYHGLTRQYRVARVAQGAQEGSSSLYQSFNTLNEALRVLARVHALPLVERRAITPGETYIARVRLSLDHSQLPKPFQIDAITDNDWRIDAKTLQWQFTAPSTGAAP